LKVIETDSVDKPRERYLPDSKTNERNQKAYVSLSFVPTYSDYGEIGVVADLFGLPEVAAVVSGQVRQAGA